MKSNQANHSILVFNCGSSSLKYKVISMPSENVIASGEAERVGVKTEHKSIIHHSFLDKKKQIRLNLSSHIQAFAKIMDLLESDFENNPSLHFDYFAHRYVHPGNSFHKTKKINKNVLKRLKNTLELAPIHNPAVYSLIEVCCQRYSRKEQFVVFDTSFHRTIPKEFSTYALDQKLARKYSLKKIGFHGISHKYVTHQGCEFLGRDIKTQKIISCHLGSGGSSVCAIKSGKSVNTSMGFTPLEGLIMNTRSGSIDAGVIFYIMFKEKFSSQEAERILNKKSGILGIFDFSSDLRDVIDGVSDNPKAKIAFNMYIKRVRKYIGSYSLILNKADILIFTDSIGTKVPVVRREICKGMGIFGIELDKNKNYHYSSGIADISCGNSQTRILVVPTDEELMIAREVYEAVSDGSIN